ncbi:MAG: hypothetical protein ACKE8G_03595 [Methylophagaceae bacterium]
MIKSRYLVLMLTALFLQPVSADEALQSAPLYGVNYQCLISNASNKDINLYSFQFLNILGIGTDAGQPTSLTNITCKKNNNVFTLKAGEACLIIAKAPGFEAPYYCRLQHNGAAGDIIGVLQTSNPNNADHATTALMPAVFRAILPTTNTGEAPTNAGSTLN